MPGQPGLAGSRVAVAPLTGDAVVVRGYVTGAGALAAAVSSSAPG